MTLQEMIDGLNSKYCKGLNPKQFSFMRGSKYNRVFYTQGTQRLVYCFVDHEGNIYKAENWKRPAKHIRGHLDLVNMESITRESYPSTNWLYR